MRNRRLRARSSLPSLRSADHDRFPARRKILRRSLAVCPKFPAYMRERLRRVLEASNENTLDLDVCTDLLLSVWPVVPGAITCGKCNYALGDGRSTCCYRWT